ncbi:MAG: hypothetical protein QQN63_00380 [Nitrosopumilus sp.]
MKTSRVIDLSKGLTAEEIRERLHSTLCTNSELLLEAAKIIGRQPGGFIYVRLLRLSELMDELNL